MIIIMAFSNRIYYTGRKVKLLCELRIFLIGTSRCGTIFANVYILKKVKIKFKRNYFLIIFYWKAFYKLINSTCHITQILTLSSSVYDYTLIFSLAKRYFNCIFITWHTKRVDNKFSELLIVQTTVAHSGNYSCSPSNASPASVLVHIILNGKWT